MVNTQSITMCTRFVTEANSISHRVPAGVRCPIIRNLSGPAAFRTARRRVSDARAAARPARLTYRGQESRLLDNLAARPWVAFLYASVLIRVLDPIWKDFPFSGRPGRAYGKSHLGSPVPDSEVSGPPAKHQGRHSVASRASELNRFTPHRLPLPAEARTGDHVGPLQDQLLQRFRRSKVHRTRRPGLTRAT